VDHHQAVGQAAEVVPLLGAAEVPRQPRAAERSRRAGAGSVDRGDRGLPSTPELGGPPHGPKDAGIRAAAADVAGQCDPDPGIVRVAVTLEQRDRAHDHARGAVAALEGADLEERLLDRVQRHVHREALDRPDRVTGGVRDGDLASAHRRPVQEHRARSALALPAPRLRAGERQLLAEREEETPRRRGGQLARRPVDDDPDGVAHWSTLPPVTIAVTLGSCRGDEPARLSRDDQHEISRPRRPG
jgi:hypothetical protein